VSARAIGNALVLGAALSACGQAVRAPAPAATPPAPVAPWPGDGLPGTLSDMEAIVARPGAIAPARMPAALLRLAALREERAQADLYEGQEEPASLLRPAIDAYERLLREHPGAPESVPAHYYLAHAQYAAGRPIEAQRVWRSLVCHDRYPWAGPGGEDTARPELPQDRDRAAWDAWANRPDMGIAFVDPFPADCRPLSSSRGDEQRYLAEAWWRIGELWFEGLDPRGGPFSYARAESAYRHALAVARPPLREVAIYKLAWTWFKEERYEQAVRGFVDVMRAADEAKKLTGDPGLDVRSEATTYIAGSLTHPDFRGTPAGAPYVPRPDVLDTERDPRIAEQKLHVALDRVRDPAIVPQNEPWTADVYEALALEYESLNMPRSAAEVDELFLQRWPLHRRAPVRQHAIARAWERAAAMLPAGSADQAAALQRARDAWAKLAGYAGATPWTAANRGDAAALKAAEDLERAAQSHLGP
jgi:hypothetical protein